MTSERGVSSQDSRTRRCITCRVCNYMLAGNLILTAYRLIRRAIKSRTIIRLSRKLPFPKDTTTRESRSFESSRWDNFRSVNLRHRSNSIERCYKIRGSVKTTLADRTVNSFSQKASRRSVLFRIDETTILCPLNCDGADKATNRGAREGKRREILRNLQFLTCNLHLRLNCSLIKLNDIEWKKNKRVEGWRAGIEGQKRKEWESVAGNSIFER